MEHLEWFLRRGPVGRTSSTSIQPKASQHKRRTYANCCTGSSKKMDGMWNRYNSTCFHRMKTETFEQETVSRVIFMHDGAPPHFSCFVTDVLNEIPWCLDWKGWNNTLATSKPRSLSTWFFSCWGTLRTLCMLRRIIQAPARKDHISHWNCNTKHDSENVAGDRISFGRLQSYKRYIYWNVLRLSPKLWTFLNILRCQTCKSV